MSKLCKYCGAEMDDEAFALRNILTFAVAGMSEKNSRGRDACQTERA